MQILKRIGLVLLWLAGLVFGLRRGQQERSLFDFAARAGKRRSRRASIVVIVVLICRGYWRRGIAGRSLILLWCLPSLSMLGAHATFEWRKRRVLQTDAAQAHSLGRHFVVGYSSFPEVAVLAEKGLISGVYITRHNIVGSTVERLKTKSRRFKKSGVPPVCHR